MAQSVSASNKLSSLNSFPIFENPYPIDIHEAPVTCTEYFADCPPDLIPVLYSVGAKHKKQGYSNKVNRTNIFLNKESRCTTYVFVTSYWSNFILFL